jgi:hypothetical protein
MLIVERRRTPTELYAEEDDLKKDLELEDDRLIGMLLLFISVPRTLMDDEYAMSVYRDP